jgi:class 3 adenylate cyclase
VRTSEVRYARIGDDHVAYRVIDGSSGGGQDVVLVSAGTMSMESYFEDAVSSRMLEGLSDLGRLVLFDRRGIGLSDVPTDWSVLPIERWCDDLEAVVAAAGLVRPVIASGLTSSSAALVYADRHPDGVTSIVLLEPTIRVDRDLVERQLAGEVDSVALFAPSRADEPGFREWFLRAGRLGASPRAASAAYPVGTEDEASAVELVAARVNVPVLVLRRPEHPLSPPRELDPILALVPGAERVELPGEDRSMFGGEIDALLAEVTRFVTGEHHVPEPDRVLAAVLFSDVVGSTEQASAMGDAHWARLLDRHDALAQSCVGRRRGTVMKSTGDGVMAIFPSAGDAVQAGIDLVSAVEELGLAIRVGIHAGDVDRRGNDLSGLAVHIAARVNAVAGSGEVLVSETVRLLASGSRFGFVDRGEHTLKGVPEPWRLYAVAP